MHSAVLHSTLIRSVTELSYAVKMLPIVDLPKTTSIQYLIDI